ncbi:MAG: winged helix DNA-binding protein [Terrisporobacter othiniensis]|nr:winged helix DNA-binding protein [Terrisporobacter othiniensis]MDU6995195.1 winged helix DNA-binding protein [Terrisporobacter othiniensis]
MRKIKEQFVFGGILLLANRLQTLGDNTLEELTIKQWFLITMIVNMESKNPTIKEIANFTGSTRQNIKQMISSLEKKGFIITKKSLDDGRVTIVQITEKCKIYLETTEKQGNKFLDRLFRNVDSQHLNNMAESIELLIKEAENYK